MSEPWVRPPMPPWPRGVQALTTTRTAPGPEPRGLGGWNLADHVGDDAAAVAANRRSLSSLTGVGEVQWLRQVHGTRCIESRRETAARVPEADAAWTAEPGLALAVLTADCVPVVVCDREASVVGVAHGGWRGLVAGVLDALVSCLPVPPGELTAWLGPAIGPGAYEVGEDVVNAVTGLSDGERLGVECLQAGRSGRAHLDLFALSEQLLWRAGVRTVTTERLCTYSDRRFFSYRREGQTGRMVTLAWIGAGALSATGPESVRPGSVKAGSE